MTLFRSLSLIMIVLVGGLFAACSSLPAFIGGYANQLESIVGITAAGTYTVSVTKDGKTLVTETWTCTTDGTKLTGCHKTGSVSTSPVATPK
jgi:FlaG/FlaF family flagellin (archaellin)